MSAAREVLDTDKNNHPTNTLRLRLQNHIIGLPEITEVYLSVVNRFLANLTPQRGPLGSLLILGPTGTGKTHSVEILAYSLFGQPYKFTRVDCAEFQEEHETSKLIGAPPGYVGHKHTQPILSQTRLDSYQNPTYKFNILLFDEIEKADIALWQLLLGALDHGKIHLGNNQTTDLSRTFIIMTSNLGSKEISRLSGKYIGFRSSQVDSPKHEEVNSVAIQAVRRHFSPEFINRLEHIVVTPGLTQENAQTILGRELKLLGYRIKNSHKINLGVSSSAQKLLLNEGFSPVYGARQLNRTIASRIVIPISNIIASGQINKNETLIVDTGDENLVFFKLSQNISLNPRLTDSLAEEQKNHHYQPR